MARPLVVEREAGPVVTDLDETAGMRRPFQGGDLGGAGRGRPRVRTIRGPQRVRPQRVVDVGEDELLVLLLVVEAQLDAIESLGAPGRLVEEDVHPLVDRVAVGADLVQ